MKLKLRPLPEYPGYAAGNDGMIYSRKGRKGERWRQLKPQQNPVTGYLVVSLYSADRPIYQRKNGGTMRTPHVRTIHSLVASVWLPPRPSPAHTVDHRDENKANCRPSNLRWLTRERNYRVFIENHPQYFAGESNPHHKLTEAKVRTIRRLQGRLTAGAVAVRFGVADGTIYKIWNRSAWRHVAA